MARAKGQSKPVAAPPSGRGRYARSGAKSVLSTSEARKALPSLAREAAQRNTPSDDLLGQAIEIAPRGEARSAFLIPGVDIEAAQQRIANLEEELEDIALMRMLEQRLAADSGNLTPFDDILREVGLDEAV
ncbi:MAG: hypothetical protein ABSG43_18470 [Solirubrobacteraceae bacterium]|jgi:hypothetical protein